MSDEGTTCKHWHVKCSRRLAKIAQTAQNKRAPANDAIVAMTTLTSRERLLLGVGAWRNFCVKWLLFLQVFRKPNFDLEPDYFVGKPLNIRFHLYIVSTEILSTFRARVEYISVFKICAIQTSGNEKRQKPPFPLGHVDPHLIDPSLGRLHSPP